MTDKPIDFLAERDKRDAKKYRLAQIQTMIDRFTSARGRAPSTTMELQMFMAEEVAAGRMPQGPIEPTEAALRKVSEADSN